MPDDGTTSPHDASKASSQTSDTVGSKQSSPDVCDAAEPTGPDALAQAFEHVAEAREYFTHFLAAEIERFKLRVRRVVIWAIAGLMGLVLLLALLVAAAGLLLRGLADFVGSLLGGHSWLGAVVVGGGLLLVGALAVAWGLWAWQASAFDAVRQRFAARKRRQQGRFGKSIDSAGDSLDK
ncbi:MAG TPA: hypothetical protein VFE46_05130 [Pirellulales bacterium]|jgi:hypothetical protein|nr:hypothetical protein [Pirellulales bacterium]